MGCGSIFPKRNESVLPVEVNPTKTSKGAAEYPPDVTEVANLALAIKRKETSIKNIELTIACENLPIVDLFSLTDPLVICYRRKKRPPNETPNNNANSGESFIQELNEPEDDDILEPIGQTEVVLNDINPRFINTFILSHNDEEKKDKHTKQLHFRIFDVDQNTDPKEEKRNLIGTVDANISTMIQAGVFVEEIKEVGNKRKDKSFLRVTSAEYDSGSNKIEIEFLAKDFSTKHQIFIKFQILRNLDWVPIHRTQNIDMKNNTVQGAEIPMSKFPGEDRCRVRIKVFQSRKSDGEVEIGCTEEKQLSELYKLGTFKVNKDSQLMGLVQIQKCHKNANVSFITYLMAGYKIKLMLAIDFSAGTEDAHKLKPDGKNEYVNAMEQIVGLLEYFGEYKEMAFYGFGAQLPPYYRTVSQCFAMNGDFFNPIVLGDTSDLVKLYKQKIDVLRPYGLTRISQIIELASEFAKDELESNNYYVLTVFTHNQIDDIDDTIRNLVQASEMPLSILLVGLGDCEFTTLNKLDSDKETLNTKNGVAAKRDIVHFIRLNEFNEQDRLSKQIFAEIPNQFLTYMESRQKEIYLTSGKRMAKSDFLAAKTRDYSDPNKKPKQAYQPKFLQYSHKKLRQKLTLLGFGDISYIKISCNDVNHFIEVESSQHKKQARPKQLLRGVDYIEVVNQLDEIMRKKELEQQLIRGNKIENIERRKYGDTRSKEQGMQMIVGATIVEGLARAFSLQEEDESELELEHPCVMCRKREIDVMYEECGHLCVCRQCISRYCQMCRMEVTGFVYLQYDE